MQKTRAGTIGKTPSSGRGEAEEPRAVAVLEDEDEGPEGAGDGQEVEERRP